MGAQWLPLVLITAFWAGVGIVLPFIVPKGPNKGIMQVILMLTGVCCWLFWLCCYVAQMNPLIGPQVDKKVLLIMAKEWGNAFP
ncbi:V-type proton ATPase subunit e [Aethina tumida]|uniref:V-type proton ATPase subunit e n=1 Tax=Aethina tumida TaxID=116153 RepID=UPI00096B4B4A|nr:V-type proton ATPase subunit e [Aethina tumida]